MKLWTRLVKSTPSVADVHVPAPGQPSTLAPRRKARSVKPRVKERVRKASGYNPYRDAEGRFSSGGSGAKAIRVKVNPAPSDHWHEEGSHPHPWAAGHRYVQDGDAVGMYEMAGSFKGSEWHPDLPDGVSVTGIVGGSPTGGGAAVIRHLTRQADKHGVALYIHPKPFGDRARLNKTKLRAWYKRHGWQDAPKIPGLFGMMIRLPKGTP